VPSQNKILRHNVEAVETRISPSSPHAYFTRMLLVISYTSNIRANFSFWQWINAYHFTPAIHNVIHNKWMVIWCIIDVHFHMARWLRKNCWTIWGKVIRKKKGKEKKYGGKCWRISGWSHCVDTWSRLLFSSVVLYHLIITNSSWEWRFLMDS